jgi:hypothetical protein
MKARRAIAITIVALGIFAGAAAATPIKWVSVQLGAHQFGRLQVPDAAVAQAGPAEVGFKKGGGCGCVDGPQGPTLFDVAPNGSIWLLDVLNKRLLVWERGRAARPARAVDLKGLDVRNFAIGRDGTIYLYAVYVEPPAGDSGADLWALSPSGHVRWRAQARIGDVLRVGPDGRLYTIGAFKGGWTPLTSSSGRPLSPAAQRRGTLPFQPLAGNLHLLATQVGARAVHFALVDRSKKVVRAWRVTSGIRLALSQRTFTPAQVGGDLVVQRTVSGRRGGKLVSEYEVLRLTAKGVGTRISLAANAVWGGDGATSITAIRVGPDGRLYQLRTNPRTGVKIVRYSLGGSK